jgi:eukaryotic-like serine/threonine-protein kinase
MLADSEKADGFFSDGEGATVLASQFETPYTEVEGERVGNFILRQQIGEGGFGMVWMAEQMEPVKRMVALKVVKAGMDTRQVLARFEAERQALAMMNHPNIAKVLEAGATSSGRPYFTMELVKGIPITDFCDQRQLDARQRLELFRDVCSAVQHAHQKGVIHRDLKPSNVMVTLAGDKPLVKIIDFGIAKATQSSSSREPSSRASASSSAPRFT